MSHSILLALSWGALFGGSVAGEPRPADPAGANSANSERLSAGAYQAGRADAEKDIRANRLAIEVFGRPAAWAQEWAKLLKEKYEIEVRGVAGCVVDNKIVAHARGYNEVSEAEIERRFGVGVLQSARSEAKGQFERHSPR